MSKSSSRSSSYRTVSPGSSAEQVSTVPVQLPVIKETGTEKLVGELRSEVLVLQLKVTSLQEDRIKEEQKMLERKSIEEKYSVRCERLYHELEWYGSDRRSQASQIIKLEEELSRMKEDRDRLRDLRDEWRSKARRESNE